MRVLVTWASKRGGTEGLGRVIADVLEVRGFEVVAAPVEEVAALDGVDAVVLGGALYANRWPASARRFVRRHVTALRKVPVWLFSSGPLDDSAEKRVIPPSDMVAVLAERVGALGHETFGGRLAEDAKGFPASAMAKTLSGDWRQPEHVRAWAARLAEALPTARPGPFIDHPARALSRLLPYPVVGWALCAALMGLLLQAGSLTLALVLHALAAPLLFSALAFFYFRQRGAREPLQTAALWTAVVALLDLVVVAGLVQRSLAMFTSVAGTWLPFALIFLATWGVGSVRSTMPWDERPPATPAPGH